MTNMYLTYFGKKLNSYYYNKLIQLNYKTATF